MKYILSLLAAVMLVLGFGASSAHAACLSISSNLSQGSSDATFGGGQVRALQNYLVSAGYLSAMPNGYFGPATYAAVRQFQSANGISTTGTIGPITRVALSVRSCVLATSVSTNQMQTQTPTQTTQTSAQNTSDTASQSGIAVIAPRGGETLNLDDSYLVRWTGPSSSGTYSVVLEDASGTPVGFIAPGVYGNQYTWKVGAVENSSTASTVTVPPGNYRIHVEAPGQGAQASDVLSRTFAISANVSIRQIFPSVVPADGNTSVVIYGSGFKSGSMVDIYGYGSVGPQYVSSDGKVIVFTVPNGVYVGNHTITVLNTYGANSNVTTESTPGSLMIIRS